VLPKAMKGRHNKVVSGGVNALLLERYSRLAKLDITALSTLAKASEYQFLPCGNVVYRQSDLIDAIYVLLSGKVGLRRYSPIHGVVDCHQVGLYETFGDGVLTGEVERRHTATADSSSILVKIPVASLRGIIGSYPELIGDWIFEISSRPRRRAWSRRLARPAARFIDPMSAA